MIVALAIGLALGDPGLRRQAVPDPLARRWSRRSTSASGCSSTGSSTTSRDPDDRRHRRLPSAGGRRDGDAVRRARDDADRTRPCPQPTAERVRHELHQADRRRPGRHAARSRTAIPSSTASRPRRTSSSPCGGGGQLQPAEADHDSTRPLLHDGRQPWGERRQPLLGTRPPRLDHRRGLLHLLAARPHRHPLSGRAGARSAAAPPARPPKLFRFDRALGAPLRRRRRRGRAAARSPGRWSPPAC